MSEKVFKDKEKPQEVRKANILAARAVADAIRTSLGPKGMDKMLQTGKGKTIVTNDGHTILQHMSVMHPAAKMLVDLSAAQDAEAGDGTTSVVVIAGALLGAAERLLVKGLHPTIIAESFQRAAARAVEIILDMSQRITLEDRATLIKAASTSLNSKIVSQYSSTLAPMAVDAVMRVIDMRTATNVDLHDIRLIKKVGGTIDDTELVDGLVLTQNVIKSSGGPSRMAKVKIGLIQFQLSPPKPDMENNVVVNDYRQMDKILKEERSYLLNMCKQIKKAKCNVLLIQKSILRDAVNDLSLHFLAKLNILVIKDIERDEIEFISKSTGCEPIADIEAFSEDKLGTADLVEEVESSGSKVVKISGFKNSSNKLALPVATASPTVADSATSSTQNNAIGEKGLATANPLATTGSVTSVKSGRPAASTTSIICRGGNDIVLDESERSMHDALCVVRCLVKQKALIAGGGAAEIEVSQKLMAESLALSGTEAFCWREFASALEVVPTTLAENAGLNSLEVVTELRSEHERGSRNAGVSMRKGAATDIYAENVLQPSLVNTSAITLAAECVKSILRIDDIALSR